MKYRTRPGRDICSLEELFVKHLGLTVPIVPQTSSYSNKHTFNRIFFAQPTDNIDDIDMVLSFSIFDESKYDELRKEALSATSPLYYIIHPDENYLTGTKLNVLFSNLANKNYTGKEQPPAIRFLLNAIDYRKLCNRISLLIENKVKEHKQFATEIESYISSILALDSILTDYCSIFKCNTPEEYISVFLLYALFDEINFDVYAKAFSTEKDNVQNQTNEDINNPHFQKIMNDIRQNNRLQKLSTCVLIVLNTIMMFIMLFVVTSVKKIVNTGDNSESFFYVTMLCMSIILTVLRIIPFLLHQRHAELVLFLDHSIMPEEQATFRVSYNRFQNCSSSSIRIQNNRNMIALLFVLFCIFYIILSFMNNSFPILVGLIAATLAAFLVIDNTVHDFYSYRRYDKRFSSKTEGKGSSSISGLAKMCRWDYDTQMDEFKHTEYNRPTNYSVDCIRHIYNQVVDYSSYTWRTLTVFILTISSIGVFSAIMKMTNVAPGYFKIPKCFTDSSVYAIIIVATGMLNILTLLVAGYHFQKIAEFSYFSGSSYPDSAKSLTLFRRNIYSGNVPDSSIARGLYNYNFYLFEKNTPIEDIYPQDDRYLISHIIYQKTHLIKVVSLCLIISYFCFAVWHTGCLENAFAILVFIVLCILFTYIIYPIWKEKRVKKEIKRQITYNKDI